MVNLSQLSTEEIIHYIEAGIIENVPGEVVLKIVKSTLEKVYEEEREIGYKEAIQQMQDKLDRMQEG